MKILVLGDIHSNHVALHECLSNVNKIDGIIFTGDYISDCPYPQKVMEEIYYLRKYFPVWMIKGNREDYQILHNAGKMSFKANTSSTGSLYYTYQNLREEDIIFFRTLKDLEKLNLKCGKKVEIFHGTIDSNRTGLYPGEPMTNLYLDKCESDIIICAHTHYQFIYKYKNKILLNPGSVGLPLGSDGKLQYAVLESDTRDAHIQLVQQNYPKDTIWREFADSGLDSMACIYSKAIKKELMSGINYMPKILYKAQELMYSYGYGGDSMNIPEICWEEAYDSILENSAGNQIS